MDLTYIKSLKTPIAIIGLGKSGISALNLLIKLGYTTEQLILFDEKNLATHHNLYGCTLYHRPEQVLTAAPKTLVVSPGVPLSSTWIQNLVFSGAHLTSEINLAASLLTSEKIIGVTGSVGKSTIVSLLGAVSKTFDPYAFVGGNLGTPLATYALNLANGGHRADWVILELSSYQLENCAQLKLDFSILTFLSANHLERYSNQEEYYQTKLKITSMSKEICLFNKTSKDCEHYFHQSKVKSKLVNAENFSHPELLPLIFLIGLHNRDNFALAIEMAKICGWPESSFIEMTRYRGLPHRIEFVAELKGVTYVNDSKATTIGSVLIAVQVCLENISADGRLYLLIGGKDKNLPWHELSLLISNNQINPVFFGEYGLGAREKSKWTGEYFEKLGSAINYCQRRAQSADVILLSPGGTSLDEFKNFEERGDFFKSLVLSGVEA